MKFTKEKLIEILNQSLDDIQNYLEDSYAEKHITDSLDFIREYISDLQTENKILETERELTTTLAEQERDVILEKKHYE